MFCNQHHLNHSGNKLWAGMFQTSLVIQSLVLSSLAIHKLCDECRRHLSSSCCDPSSMRIWSPFSLLSCHTHPCTIYLCSHHTHLFILQWLSLSTLISSGVIVSCYFWWVICFSPIKSLSSESRDEILFLGGKAVTDHVLVMLGILFVSVKYVLVSVKLVCLCGAFENL
jgi:hypothetical protein